MKIFAGTPANIELPNHEQSKNGEVLQRKSDVQQPAIVK